MRRLLGPAAAILFLAGCGDQITLDSTGTILGELVYEDGTPAAGIEVIAEGTGLSAFSEADGKFVLNGVPAVDVYGMGKTYVVRGQGDRNGLPVGFFLEGFKVKGQQAYSIGRMQLKPVGQIWGRLTLEGETDHSGAVIRVAGSSVETLTQADGLYQLQEVPDHEGYRIVCAKSGFTDTALSTMEVDGEQVPIAVHAGLVTTLPPNALSREP